MTETVQKNIFLFPLGTVLFPGGLLPLKIFEQRYLEMTKVCLRDNLPFGVCLIREGNEVGTAAVPHPVGCLATIEQWEMPHTGMFHLLARGGERFRVLETQVAANGLLSGDVEMLPPLESCEPDADCVAMLNRVIDQVGVGKFPQPLNLDDAAWVAYRLLELLPLDGSQRQRLLQIERVEALSTEVKNYLKTNS